jgi:hypothetical protein
MAATGGEDISGVDVRPDLAPVPDYGLRFGARLGTVLSLMFHPGGRVALQAAFR